MDLNKMFKLKEEQKILNEINEQSAYMKDMERYVYYGYAKGIVEMLKLIKHGGKLEGEELYKLITKEFNNDTVGNMVKRLLED